MSASAEPAPQVQPPPNLSIRSKPPSPKRLSRKVLMSGAALAGTVIVAALMLGLSPVAHLPSGQQQSTPSASGPPDTIAMAPNQYDARNFTHTDASVAPIDGDPAALEAPHDPLWANGPPPSGAATPNTSIAAPATAAPHDARASARTSAILFSNISTQATGANANTDDAHLNEKITDPRSRYELQAGNVIPAALMTGLNSDLAGRVIAQVTAPVFDSVTGDHLLIPQGSRLIGTYDTGVHYGDNRILLVWNRLIFPDGSGISLQQMTGADPSGAAGLIDATDNHLGRLSGAIGLSAIISVIANRSQNDHQDDASLSQSVGDAAAQQAAQTGSQIVQRELTVHPTLRVRPGASVRVLVTRDITLRPYR